MRARAHSVGSHLGEQDSDQKWDVSRVQRELQTDRAIETVRPGRPVEGIGKARRDRTDRCRGSRRSRMDTSAVQPIGHHDGVARVVGAARFVMTTAHTKANTRVRENAAGTKRRRHNGHPEPHESNAALPHDLSIGEPFFARQGETSGAARPP